MFLEKITYDAIRKNITTYGNDKLKDLIGIAEFEDIPKSKIRSLLLDSMKINNYKENNCWVSTDIFKKKVINKLRLSKEEKILLNKLFESDS